MRISLLYTPIFSLFLFLPICSRTQTINPTSFYTQGDSIPLSFVIFEMGNDSSDLFGLAVNIDCTDDCESWITSFSVNPFAEQWTREFHLSGKKLEPFYLSQVNNGDIYVGSKIYDGGSSPEGLYLVKLKDDGNLIWEKDIDFSNDFPIDIAMAAENNDLIVAALLDSSQSRLTADYTTILSMDGNGVISQANTFLLASNSLGGNIELAITNSQLILATEDEILLFDDTLGKKWHVYGAHQQPSSGDIEITDSKILGIDGDIYMYYYLFTTAEGYYNGSNIFFKIGSDGLNIQTGHFKTSSGQYYGLTTSFSGAENLISVFGKSYTDDMWASDELAYYFTLGSEDLSLKSKYLFQDSCGTTFCKLNKFQESTTINSKILLSMDFDDRYPVSTFDISSDNCLPSIVQDNITIEYALDYAAIDWFDIDTLNTTAIPVANYIEQSTSAASWASLQIEEICYAAGIEEDNEGSIKVVGNKIEVADNSLLPLHLTLYTMDGSLAYRKTITNTTTVVKTDAPGLYIMSFENNKGFIENHKIILIQHP